MSRQRVHHKIHITAKGRREMTGGGIFRDMSRNDKIEKIKQRIRYHTMERAKLISMLDKMEVE